LLAKGRKVAKNAKDLGGGLLAERRKVAKSAKDLGGGLLAERRKVAKNAKDSGEDCSQRIRLVVGCEGVRSGGWRVAGTCMCCLISCLGLSFAEILFH